MKNLLSIFYSLCVGIPFLVIAQQPLTLNENEAEAIGIETYIYGYPLVTMDMTRRVMTNVETADGTKAPMGQFANIRAYPDPSFKDVTAPNADTLYSSAWIDLTKEPIILHVPDENGRYYLMPMLSNWTDVFASLGIRTTGTKAGDFAITGPNWKGQLPNGLKEVKSPTNIVWILGRTYSTGTPEDYQLVHAIQNQYTLTPLSYFEKPYTPPKGKLDPHLDTKTPVRDQVNNLDAIAYFDKLAALLIETPPTKEDVNMVAKMAKIGIIPGQKFDKNKLDPKITKALEHVPQLALKKIADHEKTAGKNINGWTFSLKTGTYGTDYLQRAFITAIGLGANLPQDAIYPTTLVDNKGQILNGVNRYLIHFDKGQLPPVKGFWSLTMYNSQYFFVDNPLNRYTLSPRNNLKYNVDGSLDLFIQHDNPGKDKESNWLPAPKDDFVLMMRFYWPEESLLNGSWKIPAVQRIENAESIRQ